MTTQRAKQAVGGTRVDRVCRVVWLVVLAVTAPVLAPVVLGAGLLYMVLDVLYGVVLGKGHQDGMVLSFLKGLPIWYLRWVQWVLTGGDRPGIIPYGIE